MIRLSQYCISTLYIIADYYSEFRPHPTPHPPPIPPPPSPTLAAARTIMPMTLSTSLSRIAIVNTAHICNWHPGLYHANYNSSHCQWVCTPIRLPPFLPSTIGHPPVPASYPLHTPIIRTTVHPTLRRKSQISIRLKCMLAR